MMAGHANQPGLRLGSLLQEGLASLSPAEARVEVSGMTLDSRAVRPGDLFLACPGTSRHGMTYLDQALASGAAAVLAGPSAEWPAERIRARATAVAVPLVIVEHLERRVGEIAADFFGHPSQRLYVTGITGTNGKTSCAHFLAEALGDAAGCALIGTLGNGFLNHLDTATHTTPDAVRLQALLADFVDQGASDVAMEVSSHALHQHRVAGVEFDVAVFTNLSRDHLDYHESMEEYGSAKARLFASAGLKAAVINVDDPFGHRLLAMLDPGVESVTYGLSMERPVEGSRWLTADEVALTPTGLEMQVRGSWGRGELRSSLLGRFNAMNLLAVLGVLLIHGIALPDALRRLSMIRGVPGRMERFTSEGAPTAIVDYAHTPDALEQLLLAARAHCAGRLICVFGCGGDRDRGKRSQMGAVAERLADALVLTDDNPRLEDGNSIISHIQAGMKQPELARVERNRALAIDTALADAAPGDWVVVAGKGHETVQISGDLVLPFSDRDAVRKALGDVGR